MTESERAELIRHIVAAAPPLTERQRAVITRALRPVEPAPPVSRAA